MKIERISENQLKLTLTKADLAERKIKLEDLISPSERTQKLFRDIMEQAWKEAGTKGKPSTAENSRHSAGSRQIHR